MYRTLLQDARFYAFKLEADRTLLAEARKEVCAICGDVVHTSDFPRKPRGGPAGLGLGEDANVRFSLCCAQLECRTRRTPASLRFLGRKVYLGAVVVVVTAMRHGASPARMKRLEELFGVSRRTVERWRAWWQTTFTKTVCWREAAASFVPAVEVAGLPASLLARFRGGEEEQLVLLLRLLAPLTGGVVVHAP